MLQLLQESIHPIRFSSPPSPLIPLPLPAISGSSDHPEYPFPSSTSCFFYGSLLLLLLLYSYICNAPPLAKKNVKSKEHGEGAREEIPQNDDSRSEWGWHKS
jgi:hypothetical protein